MQLDNVRETIRRIENKIGNLNTEQSNKRSTADEMRRAASDTEQEMVRQIANAQQEASDSALVDSAIQAIEREYRELIEARQQEAETMEREAQELDVEISQLEDAKNDLLKHEQFLRDYLPKVDDSISRARQVIS